MSAYDDKEFKRYTYKSELDKALHTLEGIIKGVAIDKTINIMEIEELQNWCSLHNKHLNKHPFDELVPLIQNAIRDNVLSEEEVQDILWLRNNLKTESEYYDIITSDLQRLHGILHGIMADGTINDIEIHELNEWLEENSHLSSTYPYAELCSLLTFILADGKIDERERATLKVFISEFVDLPNSYNINREDIDRLKRVISITGICSMCPEIKFDGTFCFTGKSSRATRDEIVDRIFSLGGIYNDTIVKDTKYLIVGNDGNPCWAFSCYGRKVEKAMQMRRQGKPIVIIHENDFWDAVQDLVG